MTDSRKLAILLFVASVLTVRGDDCDDQIEATIDRCQWQIQEDDRIAGQYSGSGGYEIRFSGPPNPQNLRKSEEQENRQLVFECIASAFESNKTCLDSLSGNPRFMAIVRECKDARPKYSCDPSYPYRSYNGSCNNLSNPEWGSWSACQERLFEPSYRGTAGFRRSVTSHPLPGARVVSLKFSHGQKMTKEVSHLFPLFGQFVAHDMTDTTVSSINGAVLPCCKVSKKYRHPQCTPIKLPQWDPFYSWFNQTCMSFARSAPCDTCSLEERRQINQATSFLDGSAVYGSTEEINAILREFRGGRLETQESNTGGSLLPPFEGDDGLCPMEKGESFFLAGDRRVNQHLSLTSLQTLFMREHNRVAGIIESRHPGFDDETIFQEARKIVNAELQSVIYKEFLPLLVGEETMNEYNLSIHYDGTSHYDPFLNPTILTEFNTAGYRLHSLINFLASDTPIDGKIMRFKETFENVGPLYHGAVEDVFQGTSTTPAQRYDKYVVGDLTEFLYLPPCFEKGLDIASANVKRGRDHGLPPYYQVLQQRTGRMIKNFQDISEFVEPAPLAKLVEIYKDVRDVDLWIGLLSEYHDTEAVLGPTARMLVGEQFWRLRYGDRFFHTEPGQFSEDEQIALNSVSFARILCDNLEIEKVRNNPFRLGKFTLCSNIPKAFE